MKKHRFLWKLVALSIAPLSCLGALGVSTYAWFMARHRVSFQGENIKVEAPGFDKYRLFAYSVGGNPTDGSEPTRSYSDYALLQTRYPEGIPASLDPSMNGNFDDYFQTINGIELQDVFPSTCFTFAFYLESSDFTDFSVGLTADSSVDSTQTNYLEGTSNPIVLASAIDIYAKVITLDSKASETNGQLSINLNDTQKKQLNAFLTTEMGNGDPIKHTAEDFKRVDRFEYRQDRDNDNPSSISRGLVERTEFKGAALVVFTIEFTDFKDTHLRRVVQTEDGITYWEFDDSSSFRVSTPYQGLQFKIKSIEANGNR